MGWQRLLTGAERWQWQFDRAAVLNFTLIARVGGRVEQQRLRDAFDVIAARYPHFTARVTPRSKPCFVAGPGPISVRVSPWRPGEWKAVGVDEVNTQFAETAPIGDHLVSRVVRRPGEFGYTPMIWARIDRFCGPSRSAKMMLCH